jgi:hypothetical protein
MTVSGAGRFFVDEFMGAVFDASWEALLAFFDFFRLGRADDEEGTGWTELGLRLEAKMSSISEGMEV